MPISSKLEIGFFSFAIININLVKAVEKLLASTGYATLIVSAFMIISSYEGVETRGYEKFVEINIQVNYSNFLWQLFIATLGNFSRCFITDTVFFNELIISVTMHNY